MEIRELLYEEMEAASRVLWLSFYHAEKHNHSMAGMEHFRDLISPVSLSMNFSDGSAHLYGVFEKGALLAVGGLREKKHIVLLYVLPEHEKKGIGTRLLTFMEDLCTAGPVTLNSSDLAVPFYRKRGYLETSSRRIEEDLIFTPMEKNKKIKTIHVTPRVPLKKNKIFFVKYGKKY